MGSKWIVSTAAEFCESVRDGTHDSPKPVNYNGHPLVTSKHITSNRLDLANAYLISEEDFRQIEKRSKVDQWDVLITMIGTVGEPCLISYTPDFAIKNIGLFKSKGQVEGQYLYYYLLSPLAQDHIRTRLRGTTQQYIPLAELRALPVFHPTCKSDMEAIAHILGSLDDKIELNRRMNATLEAMAQALFQSWFVDFDPVIDKALAAGNPIPEPLQQRAQARRELGEKRKPLPADVARHFPDRFVFTEELGWVPEGWEVMPLLDR
jgi:type I restriction enzyme S subunit